jgi:lipopolysaccharide transport system permease protein
MVLLNILDFAVILILLATLMTFKGYLPPTRIIWLPLVLAYTLVAAISAGVWLSALNVRYRDIGIGLPFLIQIGALISPVGFTTHLVPVEWRPLFSLNPMVGIIELFRFALLNEDVPIYWEGVALSVAVVSLLAISGIFYFRESEKVFLDHA